MRSYFYSPRLNGNLYEKKKIKLISTVVYMITAIFFLLSVFAVIAINSYKNAVVEGLSMYPTINATSSTTKIRDVAFYTSKKGAKKGDIIIVNYEGVGDDFEAIKRLIATGGDTICYYAGHILLNGKVLKEKYLDDAYDYLTNNSEALKRSGYYSADEWKETGYATAKGRFENWCSILANSTLTNSEKLSLLGYSTEFFANYDEKYSDCISYSEALETYVLKVPKNFVFFLGDNRAGSKDCNSFGPLENKYVEAKVMFLTDENSTKLGNFTKELIYLFA